MRRPKSVAAICGSVQQSPVGSADREKNVASEVAATLNSPTQWLLGRLYQKFLWLKLGILSGDSMSAVHFLIHTRIFLFPLVNLSLDEFLLRSPRPGAYYSPHLQYHKVSTPQFKLDELKNNKPYLTSSKYTHQAQCMRLSSRGRSNRTPLTRPTVPRQR